MLLLAVQVLTETETISLHEVGHKKVIRHRKRSNDSTKCGVKGVRDYMIVSLGLCGTIAKMAQVRGSLELDTTQHDSFPTLSTANDRI